MFDDTRTADQNANAKTVTTGASCSVCADGSFQDASTLLFTPCSEDLPKQSHFQNASSKFAYICHEPRDGNLRYCSENRPHQVVTSKTNFICHEPRDGTLRHRSESRPHQAVTKLIIFVMNHATELATSFGKQTAPSGHVIHNLFDLHAHSAKALNGTAT